MVLKIEQLLRKVRKVLMQVGNAERVTKMSEFKFFYTFIQI